MTESDKFVQLHDQIRALIEANDFKSVNDLMQSYIKDKNSSVGSLKTILLITKSFKNNETISASRKEMVLLLEEKLGKKLI